MTDNNRLYATRDLTFYAIQESELENIYLFAKDGAHFYACSACLMPFCILTMCVTIFSNNIPKASEIVITACFLTVTVLLYLAGNACMRYSKKICYDVRNKTFVEE